MRRSLCCIDRLNPPGEAVKSGVEVLATFGEGLPPVPGDRVQLQQVMLNLIVNAIESMISSNRIPVVVRDCGPGIAAAEMQHVFDAFCTTKAHGLGMGLSICHSIVEAHGACYR